MGQDKRILIAGAGIGGLTLALALAQRGIPASILETSPQLSTIGAGIQISPNAARLLLDLGLGDALRRAAVMPEAVIVRSGSSGKTLAKLPLGQDMETRYGVPYYVIHRADLQGLLLDAVKSHAAEISMTLGEGVESYEQSPDSVNVRTTSGKSYGGPALIGADGLRSRVRGHMLMDGPPHFSGYVAWRGLIDAARAPEPMERAATGLWLGRKAHLVHYPLRAGKLINIVAIIEGPELDLHWGEDAPGSELRPFFSNWHQAARGLLSAVETWQRWCLFDRPAAAHWCDERVVLMGDAAHPVLPFLAQGGALAIEDAVCLADKIAGADGNLPVAFKAFETMRRARATRVQMEARSNGRLYHLPQPLAFLRDAFMTSNSGAALVARQDWIYSWRP